MRIVDLVHRWTGGLIGLVLALLGLTGAILVHRRWWVRLPHAHETLDQSTGRIAGTAARLMGDAAHRPQSIIFANSDLTLDRLTFKGDAGAYTDQAGELVASWSSQWARPELWLFDLHHHLLIGETGERIVGVAGLCGIAFVITGAILWWRTRKTFEFRLWPKRLSRPAIVRQHRDYGIVIAPLLLLSFVTGTLMAIRPLTVIAFGADAPAAINASRAMVPPPYTPAAVAKPELDWAAMVHQARDRFPDAEIRRLQLPAREGGTIIMRLRRPFEWIPDGRTLVWFDPADGRMIGAQDASVLPPQASAYNMLFPLHAGDVRSLAYRLLMTLSGLSLAMLGTLTVWTFWFKRGAKQKRPGAAG